MKQVKEGKDRLSDTELEQLVDINDARIKAYKYATKKLRKSLRGGGTLPLQCPPTHTNKNKEVVKPRKQSKVLNPRNYKPTVRTKDQIEASGAYEKLIIHQHTTLVMGRDNEKNKQRLANIMAFGEDIDPNDKKKKKLQVQIQEPPVDRFDELQAEIDERRGFLREWKTLDRDQNTELL
ncbi:unnamed protein product [Mytilus edulis]|uniref:Uncharacterized protein n=1 Tax=Mytilus edulis TaxID=6550 RepID=A0A8S3SWU6_MYTED|nr:unnamed protein product [Mytilus edulis]